MSGHTPGPWIAVHSTRNDSAVRVDAPKDFGIPGAVGSVVRQNGIGMPASPVGKANARLIAAAPDMLAALQALADALPKIHEASAGVFTIAAAHGCKYPGPTYESELQSALSAIAKATGAQ